MSARRLARSAGAAVLMTLSLARAEPSAPDLRAAMSAFGEGVKLLHEGDWEAGCARFDQSAALVPRPSSLAKVGICHRHFGRYRAAWASLHGARALNSADPSRYRQELEQEIQAELAAIPVLHVELAEPPQDVELRVDGEALTAEHWHEAQPLELGPHRLEASAPGYRSFGVSFECEGELKRSIVVRLERQDETVVAAIPASPPRRVAAPRAPSPLHDEREAPRTRRYVGVGLGTLGLVGLATSGALGILTLARVADSNEHCAYPDGSCDGHGVALRKSASHLQTAGITVAAVSAAVLGAGIYFYATAPRTSGVRARLGAAVTSGQVALAGELTW